MGLFGKKENKVSKDNEKIILKEGLDNEIEKLQEDFRTKQEEYKTKQEELDSILEKIQTVKEEYNITVNNVMEVKKELNQKKMELDVIKREHSEILVKIKNSDQIKDKKSIDEFNKTKENMIKMDKEFTELQDQHKKINEQIKKDQAELHGIKKQQIESEKQLEVANSRLYNASAELQKKNKFQDADILTPKEREFIQGEQKSKNTSGIIEAASAVVGSLKSKLNTTQKELEAIQLQLEKERELHAKAKKEIDQLKESMKKS